MAELIDRILIDGLKESLGDLTQEAFSAFYNEVEERLAILNSATNAAEAKIHFHSIKGTGAAYGATALSQLAAELENQAESQSLDQDSLSASVGRLNTLWIETKALY